MKVKFFCPRWGSEQLSWELFFQKVKTAGYDGVEMGFPPDLPPAEKQLILDGLDRYALSFIGQHWQAAEPDFDGHCKTYETHLYSLAAAKPLFINSQTGKDYFSMAQNLTLIQKAREISRQTGVEILHETHRGKWSFAAHITKVYLETDPEIRITLDASHWCNVAETYLEDQAEAMALAIAHTDHIHARVGHTEGPQVPDPEDSLWADALRHHLAWWDAIVGRKKAAGTPVFTITPEFGAPPYTILLPGSHTPIASQWDINLYMMGLLRERYAG